MEVELAAALFADWLCPNAAVLTAARAASTRPI
jgi:hypothetical protein